MLKVRPLQGRARLFTQILPRIVYGVFSLLSLVGSAAIIRSAYRLKKNAKSTGRLPKNIIDYADSDSQGFYRQIEERLGTLRGSGLDRVIFASALVDRYLAAVLLGVFGGFSAYMAARDVIFN